MANIHRTPIMTSVHERQVETSVETSQITQAFLMCQAKNNSSVRNLKMYLSFIKSNIHFVLCF